MRTHYRYNRFWSWEDKGEYRRFPTLNEAVKDACEAMKLSDNDIVSYTIFKIQRPDSYQEAIDKLGFIPRLDGEICDELDSEWENMERMSEIAVVKKDFTANGLPFGRKVAGDCSNDFWCWIDCDRANEVEERIRADRRNNNGKA